MKLGKQWARIKDYGLTDNKSGNNSVFIKFGLEGGSEITWFGTLKKRDNTVNEITLEQLFECGFDNEDVGVLSLGVESNALITDEDIEITLVKELMQSGQEITKVKYIGEGKQILRVSAEEIKAKLPPEMSAKIKELKNKKPPRKRKDQKADIPF